MVYLRDDFRALLDGGALGETPNIFDALATVEGAIYRQAPARRTVRFEVGGAAFFAKQHTGVGWREIAKCWLSLKRPVLGARDEFDACRHLRAHGVAAPRVAAFGERGRNPATRRSFVICDALDGFVSLEELCGIWAATPPPLAIKRKLLTALGEFTRALHEAGVQHRDYYLDHLLADRAKLASGEVALAVIDLHRARVRAQTPRKARLKDLAALRYSSAALVASRTDLLRFVGAYAGKRPAAVLRRERRFWNGIERRTERLRNRAVAKGLAFGPKAASVESEAVATVGSLADVPAEPPVPFRFDVDTGAGGRRALCEQVLFLQPRRHLVARATIDGRTMIVRAYFGKRAEARLRRERRGLTSLAAAGVKTPATWEVGRGGGARVLACECATGDRSLHSDDFGLLVDALARLHERGLRMRDPRASDFVVRKGTLYAVAGASIRRLRRKPTAIHRRACRRDIAGLLAVFPDGAEPLKAAAWERYCKARGLPFDDADWAGIRELANRVGRRRAE